MARTKNKVETILRAFNELSAEEQTLVTSIFAGTHPVFGSFLKLEGAERQLLYTILRAEQPRVARVPRKPKAEAAGKGKGK